MHRFFDLRGGKSAVGLLILRLVVGAAFVCHGWLKITGKGGMAHWMGNAIPAPFQALAAIAEFAGGLGVIVGLLTPVACFGLACTMVVALAMVHLPKHHAFVSMSGPSYELAATYLAAAVAIGLAGPGALSVDALIFGQSPRSNAL